MSPAAPSPSASSSGARTGTSRSSRTSPRSTPTACTPRSPRASARTSATAPSVTHRHPRRPRARADRGGARRDRRAGLVGPRRARRGRRRGRRPGAPARAVRHGPAGAALRALVQDLRQADGHHLHAALAQRAGPRAGLDRRRRPTRSPRACRTRSSSTQQEMYGEIFDIPAPDELIFISSFTGGEVFRSGCTFRRGHGKIFFFSPGDQDFPVYHHQDVRRVIANGVRWAAQRLPAGACRRCCATRPSDFFNGQGYGGRDQAATEPEASRRRRSPPVPEPLRLVQVGAGGMGRAWLRNLAADPDVRAGRPGRPRPRRRPAGRRRGGLPRRGRGDVGRRAGTRDAGRGPGQRHRPGRAPRGHHRGAARRAAGAEREAAGRVGQRGRCRWWPRPRSAGGC